jgi:arylsulfatase A-like enzyme/Flp pilus assembly protein TadD
VWGLFLFSAIHVKAAASPAPSHRVPVNIILITIDTVRADHLSCYGYKNIQTATLDALARDGIVFDRAIAQVPLTWPSHTVILTGTYPFQNGVQDFTGQPLAPQFRSVAQAFKQHGYATGAVVSAFVLDRSWGLARGFDFYDDAFSASAFAQKDVGLVDRKAAESVTHAVKWLQKSGNRPFFFWLHLYDPHSPYDPPEPYRARYQSHLYDGEIAYADHELGRLITWLKQAQLYRRTAIVFLSDHGESLGEHGEDEHGFFVYDSTIHIPLIVKPPAGSGLRPGRVTGPVETTAVAPALLRFAGIKDVIEKQFQSHGLFGADAEHEDQAYSETFYPFSSFGWSPLRSLETSRYHYIEAPQPELYDLTADPEEKNNLAPSQSAVAAVLKSKLQELRTQNPYRPQDENSGLSPDALEKLQALGYVAYRSPLPESALTTDLPDPKIKVSEHRSILKAADAVRAGDYDSAERLLKQLQAKDPSMYVLSFYLGQVALGRQDWERAVTELKKCLTLNPNFDQAMTALARALMYQGNTDEARQWVQKALKLNPQNYRAWYELGFIEAKSNQPRAAIEDYGKSVAIQGNFAAARRELGLLCYQEKDYSAAAEHLAKAIELGIESPLVYNNLGISYSQTGQLRKAIESYREALKLDPNLAQAHLNLAYAYQQMKLVKDADAEYRAACKLEDRFCHFVPR